jgi:hypothetical protein
MIYSAASKEAIALTAKIENSLDNCRASIL